MTQAEDEHFYRLAWEKTHAAAIERAEVAEATVRELREENLVLTGLTIEADKHAVLINELVAALNPFGLLADDYNDEATDDCFVTDPDINLRDLRKAHDAIARAKAAGYEV